MSIAPHGQQPEPPNIVGNERAPFIYCDGVSALGVQNGAIQIELAARTILPTPEGTVRNEFVATGHLRCSPAAAMALRDCLDRALAMLTPAPEGQEPPQPVPGRLN